MNLKILKKDLKRDLAGNVALILFMTLSVTLAVAATVVVTQLTTSMSDMYSIAKPPHNLQMHKGEIDQSKIDTFNKSFEGVTSWQTSSMINIDGDSLTIAGDNSTRLSDSRLDISLVKQNQQYDLLLDGDRNVIKLNQGEIGIPMVLKNAYSIKIGDTIKLSSKGMTKEFVVRTFVHDAQMNSPLVYSTRLLVSDSDFDQLLGIAGESEYLIETYFTNTSLAAGYQSAYENAGLPQDGPTVPYQGIVLLSAFTDIILAMIILLVSVLLVIISLMSIKYTLLASLEEEIGEIGTMKAIGMTYKDIRDMYLKKYRFMIITGVMTGYLIALMLSSLFTAHINTTFGAQPFSLLTAFTPVFACLLLYWISLHYCKKILKKIKKVTVVDALVLSKGFGKDVKVRDGLHRASRLPINLLLSVREMLQNFRGFSIVFLSMLIVSAIMIIPINLLTTLRSKEFIPYMGSQVADILIEVDSGENLAERYRELNDLIRSDPDVVSYNKLRIVRVETVNSDKQSMNLRVGSGEKSGKGLKYLEGKEPIAHNELAISKLNADEMAKKVGDSAVLRFSNQKKDFVISGVYQDVTSGGLTAKAINAFEGVSADRYQFTIDLKDIASPTEKAEKWSRQLGAGYDIQPMDELIDQTLGVVAQQVQFATVAVTIIGGLMIGFIVLLFMKLRLTKDMPLIAGLKAIGFTNRDIRHQYLYKLAIISLVGIVVGTVLANLLGEKLVSLTFSVMGLGISELTFIINPWIVFMVLPLGLLVISTVVTWFSTERIRHFNIISLINE